MCAGAEQKKGDVRNEVSEQTTKKSRWNRGKIRPAGSESAKTVTACPNYATCQI